MKRFSFPFFLLFPLLFSSSGSGYLEWREQPTLLATAAARDFRASDRLVVASYYPWYIKTSNWADDPERLGDHPLIGSYRSDDPRAIDYQLSLARAAGVDAFLLSWATGGDASDRLLGQMLETINREPRHRGFKVGILYENVANMAGAGVQEEQIIADLSYLWRTYGRNPALLRVDGKPVIFVYEPDHIGPDQWRGVRETVTHLHGPLFLVASPNDWCSFDGEPYVAAPDGYCNADDYPYLEVFDSFAPYADKYISDEDLLERYQAVREQIGTEGRPLIATLFGGGSRVQKFGFDFRRDKGLYIRQRFAVARTANINWINITSWNEWYEYNQVEPSREYGFETVKYIREMTATFKGVPLTSFVGAALAARTGRAGSGICPFTVDTGAIHQTAAQQPTKGLEKEIAKEAIRKADQTEERPEGNQLTFDERSLFVGEQARQGRFFVTVENTGNQDLYAIQCEGDGRKTLLDYLLHPGESKTVCVPYSCTSVTAFLPDNTFLGVAPSEADSSEMLSVSERGRIGGDSCWRDDNENGVWRRCSNFIINPGFDPTGPEAAVSTNWLAPHLLDTDREGNPSSRSLRLPTRGQVVNDEYNEHFYPLYGPGRYEFSFWLKEDVASIAQNHWEVRLKLRDWWDGENMPPGSRRCYVAFHRIARGDPVPDRWQRYSFRFRVPLQQSEWDHPFNPLEGGCVDASGESIAPYDNTNILPGGYAIVITGNGDNRVVGNIWVDDFSLRKLPH